MSDRPLILIDFDGVINQFPDDKIRQRRNSVDWMKPDDPRRRVYDPANWLIPDRKEHVRFDRRGTFRILWSDELVRRLDALDADILWLSTWQPHTDLLNQHLGVDWETIRWYDPITDAFRYTGKRRAVISHLKTERPIIWIDDEETTREAQSDVFAARPSVPVLGVGPDARIGISRPQLGMIERFVSNPPVSPDVRFDVAGGWHEGHWGF
ncbi:hypothetical protein [Bifidobacterium sp. SO1]|uniref:hypothetical protein n=1 Tax=Bifidobacterium sp. SO1 TaxID=2809029 RepID=UPI001BDC1B9B|nr:hypothetical protein [Bifidobacterium sp. SO1]MBT1162919.1 hypothetical protein [Bifidobacterium sp. SO1]